MAASSRPYDLVVIGAGSGGMGASIAAAQLGLRVCLLESSPDLGGNANRGGVNCWEPGTGGTGLPFEIYKRLKRIPQSVGIYTFGRHQRDHPGFPGGEAKLDPTKRYADSLRRFTFPGENRVEIQHGVPFEPVAYSRVLSDMLAETGNVAILLNSAVKEVEVDGRKISGLRLANDSVVRGAAYVDATASISVARLAGCDVAIGRESRETYGETGAPVEADDQINAVTQIYRVDPHYGAPAIEPLSDDISEACWWNEKFPSAVFNEYPGGGLNVNMLPTMEGREYLRLGCEAAKVECARRIRAHWHWVQSVLPEMQDYQMTWCAPALGVREGHRLIGRYILTQTDLDATLREQTHDDVICIADHAKDVHGEAHVSKELTFPYGVPYRCLLPKEFDNLLVACRGASFSSIAASSCRLSRTIMQLGQAAGTAAAIAKIRGIAVCDVPGSALREALRKQHVQLEWPAPPELQAHLEDED